MYTQFGNTSRPQRRRGRGLRYSDFDWGDRPVPKLPKAIFHYHRGKRRKVAVLVGDTLRKVVKGSEHTLISPRESFAISKAVLEKAKRFGAKKVEVIDQESCRRWVATIAEIEAKGFSVTLIPDDPQVALPITKWTELNGSPYWD